MMYRTLSSESIIATCERLQLRIAERFPESGLSRVALELLLAIRESSVLIERLRRPNWMLRIASAIGLIAILGAAAGIVLSMRLAPTSAGLVDILQGLESGVNDIVFLGIAIFFLVTVEGRLKRRKALRALHQLRSIAHVIDMHQLTKDPEQLLSPVMATASSPRRDMTRFSLSRYLDYCSELLSLTSKAAALFIQNLDDPMVLNAVNDIQTLATGLSAKIWQKIVIIDSIGIRNADNFDSTSKTG